MNAAERRLISYTAAAHALVHIIELTYPALLTRIADDFGVRAVILGGIASVFSWAFGGSAIPAGFLTDRLGSRRVLFYAFAGATGSLVLVGLSPNEWVLAATLALLGFCIGLYHPAGLSLMAQGVRQRGLALGFHGVSGNVGQALAPALAVGLAIAVDWRLAFFFLAGVSAVMAALLSITTLPLRGEAEVFAAESETPGKLAGVLGNPAAGRGVTAEFVAPQPGEAQPKPSRSFFIPLLLVYAAFVLSGVVYRGAITFLPTHLEDFVDKDLGAAFVTVALLTGAVGQIIGGTLSQRVRLERLAPLLAAFAVPALILVGVVSGGFLVVAASVFIFFYFMNQPVFTGLIADYAPAGAVGRSYGFSFFAGFGLGGTGGVIAGALVDRWDTAAAFLGLSVFMGVTLLLSVAIWLMSEQRSRSMTPEIVGGGS
ncbi:MAG: MFS transporter [Dehalococcoidia bacterium]|nr:MFS transporter [Dehalococcoidia bacterium]